MLTKQIELLTPMTALLDNNSNIDPGTKEKYKPTTSMDIFLLCPQNLVSQWDMKTIWKPQTIWKPKTASANHFYKGALWSQQQQVRMAGVLSLFVQSIDSLTMSPCRRFCPFLYEKWLQTGTDILLKNDRCHRMFQFSPIAVFVRPSGHLSAEWSFDSIILWS